MSEKFNAFRPGSLAHLIVEAEHIEDILYIIAPELPEIPVKIICKPNYDIDSVLNFVNDNLEYGIPYDIVVENNYEVIKMSEKRVFLYKYINESFSSNIPHKEIEKSCSNCKNHTWDWDIDDGHYGDEYEVCLKNNDLDGPCEDYEEM